MAREAGAKEVTPWREYRVWQSCRRRANTITLARTRAAQVRQRQRRCSANGMREPPHRVIREAGAVAMIWLRMRCFCVRECTFDHSDYACLSNSTLCSHKCALYATVYHRVAAIDMLCALPAPPPLTRQASAPAYASAAAFRQRLRRTPSCARSSPYAMSSRPRVDRSRCLSPQRVTMLYHETASITTYNPRA